MRLFVWLSVPLVFAVALGLIVANTVVMLRW
jgi:hypothetical protein